MIISGDAPMSKGARRFEVFTGAGKRRDWSDARGTLSSARAAADPSTADSPQPGSSGLSGDASPHGFPG